MTQRTNYAAAAPGGMKALGSVHGYVSQSGLPPPLIDLVYLRVSQINGCAYCIDMHSRDLLKANVPVRSYCSSQLGMRPDPCSAIRKRRR